MQIGKNACRLYSVLPPHPKTGVFWGAFDPPTEAHIEIIKVAINRLELDKFILGLNGHPYKKYMHPLAKRIALLQEKIPPSYLCKVEILTQEKQGSLDYFSLKKREGTPLWIVAGSDAYNKWISTLSREEIQAYGPIAVVPRGDEPFDWTDKNVFPLLIEPKYGRVSSSIVRAALPGALH